jgi:2-polyprenylphenol 6-hydroxylase
LLPLSDSHTSSIVFTTTPRQAHLLAEMPAEEFNAILTRESGSVMGEMTVLSERKVFPLQTHHAKDYAISRCVLVGDAAHTIHPLAGQGVNLGFKDVYCLMKVLQEAKMRKKDIGALSLLKRYQRQRKGDNQLMIWAMEAFKRGFGSRNAPIMLLRNSALNFTDKQLWLKQFFAKMALG